jgi:O-antigen/teichoic acid export membrane protein
VNIGQEHQGSVGRATSRLKRWAPGAARIGSFADQGFQGVGNILVNIMLVHALTHEEFAGIGVMIGIHFFAWGLHRSNIVLPLIVNASDAAAGPRDEDAWWWINLISVALICAALAVARAIFGMLDPEPTHRWLVSAIGWAAIASPWICFIEFGRRRLYQQRRGVMAAFASAVSTGVMLAVAAIDWRGGLHNALLGACAWAFGGMAGTLVATLAAPPRRVAWSEIRQVWRRHQHFALWQSATAVPYAFYTTIVVILVAAFSGAAGAAAYTAARTLINPAMALVSAIDTLDKPRAAKALLDGGVLGLQASIRRTLFTVIGLTGPYLFVLTLFSSLILRTVFGPGFGGYGLAVSFLAVAGFFACLNQAPETNLIVLRAGQSMFAVRMGVAVLTVICMAAGARYLGFLGCTIALLLINILNFVALRLASQRVLRAWAAA